MLKKLINIFIYLSLLFCLHNLIAQNQVQFKHLETSDGLSNGTVTDIVQDSIGFIWIATKNGLNRYDGKNFKAYNQLNSGISSNDISVLKIDSSGRLWIGTVGGGINIYNSLKDEFIIFKNNSDNQNSISSDEVHTIFEDQKGNIWVGTENGLNLFLEETRTFKSFVNIPDDPHSISHNSVWSIFEQDNGDFWIGTYGGGLNKLDRLNNRFINYYSRIKVDNDIPIDFINSINSLEENELLIGSNGQGLISLNLLDNTASNFFEDSAFIDVSIIRTIWIDSHKTLWVGTDGNGIIKIKKLENGELMFENYLEDSRSQSTLSNNTVNTFLEDTQSNIWIGTAWKGINIMENKINNIYYYYSDNEGFNSSPILSVFKNEKELWMGTDGEGISIYDDKSQEVLFLNKENHVNIGGDFIQCIRSKGGGEYWIGTFANGLILYDSRIGIVNQFKRKSNDIFSIPYNDVRDILELPTGNLLVGTWGGGLSLLDHTKNKFVSFRRSNDPNSISSDNVLSIQKNDDESYWVATYGGGLNLFNMTTEKFTRFIEDKSNPLSIGSNYIFSLLKEKNDFLWLGTKNGLLRLDPKTLEFKRFIVGNTVNSNTIVGLLQDDYGNIWMSTKEGIYNLNIVTNKIQSFPEITEKFHINSTFKDRNGILYFGSVERVVSFDPQYVKLDNFNPNVVLTDVKLYNKSLEISDESILKKQIYYAKNLSFNYDENVLTFNFTALKYPLSIKEQYSVMMEGFENEWRDIGRQNSTTFTNLPPGDYIFKVKSQSNNNDEQENGVAKINIKILPPAWKTWWAYVSYFIFLIGLLLAYQRYTLRYVKIKNKLKIEKLHREQEDRLHELKQRFFTNISHEIRTPLTLILGPLNNLLKKGEFSASEQKQLSTIKNSTNRLLNLVNELLNFRKLETGHVKLKVSDNNIVEFVNEIYLSYSQHATNNKILYEFHSTNNKVFAWFDKVQLEKAIYNLLSNAFKFSKQGDSVTISIEQDSQNVYIIICDTGIGIPKEKLVNIFERFYQNENNISENKGFGIGLSITKDIVELHSGCINVKSKLGEGSEFIIELPLGKKHFKKDDILSEVINEENIDNYISAFNNADSEKIVINEEFSGETVLLIEDNVHIRKHLKELLSETYIIYEAPNGKDGLEKAIEIVPDIVISDIMMPIMDGIAFCHQLKTDIRISHIPVILLTARTLLANKIEGYETGADDYLTKPFDESILKVRVKNLLNNRKMLRDQFLKEQILNPKRIALNSPDEEFLNKLARIVEERIEESEFNMDKLSKEMAMGHSNIYKKIKALTGMTIVGFVKDFRLKRAAQLLSQDKIQIIDVCFMVGYTDRRHFSKEFKKKFGVSPSVYIKST